MATQTLDTEKDYLFKLRHSTTHVMAQAVQELFPGTKIAIGPPIDDGFYYDFDSEHPFTPDDLKAIERRMRQIAEGNHKFEMSTHDSKEAREFWLNRGEKYKVEIIDDLKAPTVTYCSHDKFTDLCRGNHLDTTKEIRHFKLLKIAGAYWRGDEKREQLQRIYGTAWRSQKDLDDYLKRLEEAKKRDHRDLGPKLSLFSIEHDEGGSGFIYWLPKGAKLRQLVENYLREYLESRGYQFVITPHVARAQLWKTSGHLDYYKENMYPIMELENQDFILKPMNCPGHILVYKSALHSYRELPIRIGEFGTVYRFERSGVLHGLLRVRGFTQDDAHIFCRPDQVQDEVVEILRITTDILKTFGFSEYAINLSTRPEKYSGTPDGWTHAEAALKSALEKLNLAYEVDEGGGAFYGPKIDLKIKDSLGREWQCSTVQVDFNNPERFKINYRDEKSGESQVFMIHRALLGSMERFIGILIENFAGLFPLWLAPIQVKVLTIADRQSEFAQEIVKALRGAGMRVELDDGNDKIGAKIRGASIQKIPYLIILGDNEVRDRQVTVRKQDGTNIGAMTVEKFIETTRAEIAGKDLTSRF